jgi:hypothetical protein
MSPEQLRVYRDNYPPNTAEHQGAKSELELRAKEAEDKLSAQQFETQSKLDAQRHRETTDLTREEIAASHYSNWLSKWAVGIAGVALLVAGLSLYLQWRAEAKSKPHSPVSSLSPTNTLPGVSKP